MKTLFVGGLPSSTTEEAVHELFSQFGTVRSLKLAKDLFTSKCKGFGFLDMEGHEARAAIAELDGRSFDGHTLKVRFEKPRGNGNKDRRH